jgi:hypothetical protein
MKERADPGLVKLQIVEIVLWIRIQIHCVHGFGFRKANITPKEDKI